MEFDLKLDQSQRAMLAGLVSNPGWKVFEDVFKAEVDKFSLKLLNTNPLKTEEVLEAHRMAKAAAQVYAGVFKSVTAEIEQYVKAPRASDKPEEPTSVLDMGDILEENL